MQYQLVEGSGTVLFIDQVNPRLSAYTYPIEQEQQIMTNLKLGNLKQTRQMVDDFTAFLKNEQHFSYDHIRQSFIQLIAATLRTLNWMPLKDRHSFLTICINIYTVLKPLAR